MTDQAVPVIGKPTQWELYLKAMSGQPALGVNISRVDDQNVTLLAISPELLTEPQFVQVQALLRDPLHSDSIKFFDKNRSVLIGLAVKGEAVIGVCGQGLSEIVVNSSLSPTAQLTTIMTFTHVVQPEYRGKGIGSAMLKFVLDEGIREWMQKIRAYQGKWITSPEIYTFPDGTNRTVLEEDVRQALDSHRVIVRVEFENARWAPKFESLVRAVPFYSAGHSDATASMQKSSGVLTPTLYDWDNDDQPDKVLEVSLMNYDGSARKGEVVNFILIGGLGFCRVANKWLKGHGFEPMTHGKGRAKGFWGSYDLMSQFPRSANELPFPVIDISHEADVEANVRQLKTIITQPTMLLVGKWTNEMRAYTLLI